MRMRYALIKSPYKVDIRSKNIPEPNGNQVLIKTAYCGICGTDNIAAKNWFHDWTPFGHEVSGTIEKIGQNINGLFYKGQKVSVKPGAHCGQCDFCRQGNFRRCQSLMANQNGFADYILSDPRSIVTAPDEISIKALVLCEPLNVAVDIIETANITKNDSIVLFGAGLIGLLALHLSKSIGADILGVINRTKHQFIDKHLNYLNNDFFINADFYKINSKRSIFPFVKPYNDYKDFFNRISANIKKRLIVIHTAPPNLIKDYIYELPYNSSVINIGLARNKKNQKISLDMQKLMFKRIQLLSSFAVPSLYFDKAVNLISDRIIEPDIFIDNIIPLSAIENFIGPKTKKKYLKTIVDLSLGNKKE